MTDRWQDRISEYLDGELTSSEAQRFELHLGECESCRTILHELKLVVSQASHLPELEAPDELWQGIATRIAPQARSARPDISPRTASRSRISALPTPLLLAACLTLMFFSAGAGWMMRGQDIGEDGGYVMRGIDEDLGSEINSKGISEALAAGASRSQLPDDMREALQDYEESVAQLEAALVSVAGQMNPMTLEAIEGNLQVIDQAIFEARIALNQDPGSEYLSAHLADSMIRKFRLLRRVTRLASNEI